MDKAALASIIAHDGAVPEGRRAWEFVHDLLSGLGSTDPELRDELCLEIICHWIMTGQFSETELSRIAEQLLANLRAGIGAGENDQIFLRTFSAETLRFVLAQDGRTRALTPETVADVFAAGLTYMADEQDWRGYDPVKGWAHSVAHTADLLMAMADHPQAGASELQAILASISAKLLTGADYYLCHSEDFRLASTVLTILRRALLSTDAIVAWLQAFGGGQESPPKLPPGFAARHNVVSFLTALHTMLTYRDIAEPVRGAALAATHAALKCYLPRFV